MPTKKTRTAGEFVREEIHHVRDHKHGARSAEQVIAIGLAKARRAGVKMKDPPRKAKKSPATKNRYRGASHDALSAHAKAVAKRRKRH
jgi:hypothetical protein